MERSREVSMDEAFIKSLTSAVKDNLTNDQFGAEELGHIVGTSRSQIHRKLQKINGQSITQFIREIRLEEALKLLRKEVGTASEISYQVGFSSPTYFNTCFHTYFGYPPGEVKKHKGQNVSKPKESHIENDEKNIDFKNVRDSVTLYKLSETSRIPSTVKSKAQRKKNFMWSISILLILLVVSVYILSFFLPQFDFTHPFINSLKEGDRSIAVLPFKHESSEEETMYFTNGVTTSIISNLSLLGDLRVISETSTARYRDSEFSIKNIAKELHITYFLEGTVQKQNNQLKIHIRLIYGKTEEVIWTKIYQGNIKDYFESQSDIALQVAKALYVSISPEEKERVNAKPTKNLTAHDFFLRARQEHTEYLVLGDSISLVKAMRYYHTALNYDSSYARAYAGLGLAYYNTLGKLNLDDQKSPYWDSISTYTEKALFYNDQLGEAYLLRGIYNYGKNSKIEKAIEQMDMALKYDPNNYMAYQEKAFLLWAVLGKYHETIINMNEAFKRNRGIELIYLFGTLSRYYLEMGFYDLAKDYLEEQYKLKEDKINYSSALGFLEFGFGNYNLATELAEKSLGNDTSRFVTPVQFLMARQYEKAYNSSLKVVKNTNGKPWINDIHRIGFSYWKMGHKEEGLHYLNMHVERCLQSIRENSHYALGKWVYYDLAGSYAVLGEKEKAIETLTKFKNKHSYPLWIVFMLKDDPMLDNIRDDSRFQEVLHHVEEKYEHEREIVKAWLVENELYEE